MACWSRELCERPKNKFPLWFEIAANSGLRSDPVNVWLFVVQMSIVSLFIIFSRNFMLKQRSLLFFFFSCNLCIFTGIFASIKQQKYISTFFSYGVLLQYVFSLFICLSFSSPPLHFPGFSFHDLETLRNTDEPIVSPIPDGLLFR